ncbi:MAG: hypothetical protein ACKV19_27230 [Verrucomicrobiales bacterium]
MKHKLIAFAAALLLTTHLALGHGGVEIGPNGGRILELGKNGSVHGEVTLKDGKFHIALLDKDMKPVAVKDQSITATGGTRQKPEKLAVEKTEAGFVVPAVQPGQWLIVQFKENAKAKAVTARMEYNTENCDACDSPEWLCQCELKKKKEAAEKKAKP